MQPTEHFDFWYAVNNTEIVRMPSGRLETFGNTVVDYHLLTELMDVADKVRVREGRVEVFRPEIITPDQMDRSALEGFGLEAEQYMDWLRQHEAELYLLKYGFVVRKQLIRENIISETLDVVKDRVLQEMQEKDNPLDALVLGVEEPWEVCLLKLMVELVRQSAPNHLDTLRHDPLGARHEIEKAFREAVRDRSRIPALGALLEEKGLFEEYQDRFFALVKQGQ